MGKKGKGKGRGQPADKSSQSSQERPRRTAQQVYQVPHRRDQGQGEPSRSEPPANLPVDVPRREEPGHSQDFSQQSPSVAYRKPRLEEQQQPQPAIKSKGRGKPQSTAVSEKVGAPASSFFEKDDSATQRVPSSDTPPESSEKPVKSFSPKKASPAEVKELALKAAGLTLEEKPPVKMDFARRPNYGAVGHRIALYVNYFKLEHKNMSIYHYDIDILEATKDNKMGQSLMSEGRTAKEDIKKGVKHVEHQKRRNIGKSKCRQIIATMIKSKALQKFSPIYDGQKNLFTSKLLPYEDKISFPVDVIIDDKPKRYYVLIQPVLKQNKTNCIDLQPLFDLYNNRSSEIPQEVLLVYETVMNHRDPPFKQVQFRNSFFSLSRENVYPLDVGMEIWFGYNQSVHLTERGPVVIINLAAKAFHKSGPVIDYANEVLKCNITRLPRLDPSQKEILEKALKGLSVKVIHQKHPRKYKIKGLSELSAKDIMFEDDKKRRVSVVDYFHQKYNFRLSCPQLPCLRMQTSTSTNIPMEACVIVEGQPKIGKLSAELTSQMIRSTAVPPDKRFQSICRDAKNVNSISKQYLDAYGLIMDVNLMEVNGRVITAPQLQYGETKFAVPDNRGVWRIEDGKKFYHVIKVKSWALISFADERRFGMDVLSKYCSFLVKSANKCGMQMDHPKFVRSYRRNDRTEKVIEEAKRSGIDFAIVVLNRRDKFHTYDEVKFLADFKHRLVTQCMEDRTLGRINDQITTNVCLKINVKLGGINHMLKQRLGIFRTPVMVIGADAVHWTRGLGYPSIVSVVASFEPTASKYMLVCDTQRNVRKGKISQEIIRNMDSIASELLEAFRAKTGGRGPDKIIVFRDGVSDGQFQHAIDHEVSGIQKACEQVLGDVARVTYIVVQKRHQTRMYPMNPSQGVGKGRNIPPGTVVDKDITHPTYFDFFVCSHEGIQGTSKPAHYTVLHDDNGFKADELQQLCHFLCHTYVRCTRSVSLPAPVLYADLAAFRAKKYADLFIESDDVSVSSEGSEDIQREFPPNVKDAIRSMKSFEHNMFYI